MGRRERLDSGPTPRLYQRAFAILARQIREGTIPAGTRLQESSVAQQFGISRAPARRALAELEQGGLVEKPKGRGYLVRAVAVGKASPAGDMPPPESAARLLSLPPWERIYAQVEDEIIARIAFASWRMNEAELARCYGVSRTVTRDVVGRLQQRGDRKRGV